MAGRGRGNLLNIINKREEQKKEEERLKKEAELRKAAEDEEQSRLEIQRSNEEKLSSHEDEFSIASTSTVSRGRANLLNKLRITPLDQTSKTSVQTTSSGTLARRPGSGHSEGHAGVLGRMSSLSLDETRSSVMSEPEVISRQGESGKKIHLTANYINVKINADKGLFMYEVKFTPDVESISLRRKLLNQHLNDLGNVKTFDGAQLYLPIMLPNKTTTFHSVHPNDDSTVILTIIFKKKQAMKDNVLFFNNLMNRVLYALKLIRIGRHNYNPTCAHKVPQHRLEVWPGYITSISELEGGLKLNLDAVHRVVRLDTVRDFIAEITRKNPRNFKNVISNEIIGTSVLTRYNNRTYKIDDVNWTDNPMLKFRRGDEEMSLVDYYKQHYDITIQDLKQPLLVNRAKIKNTTGETVEKTCLLVPELCFVAGLTDSIRNDFKVTQDLAKITRVSPEQRRIVIKNFLQQVNSNEVAKKILSDWGLELENDTVDFMGRTLVPEEIHFGNGYVMKPNIPDWTRPDNNNRSNRTVLRPTNIENWAILYTHNNKKCCDDFIETLGKACSKVGIRIRQPKICVLNNDDSNTYVQQLRALLKNNRLDIVVIVLPTLRQDKYAAVKKVCCVEMPIPSQVIIAKTISRLNKLNSVTEKIALQMNCKLGGALWALKNPYMQKNAMVCGIDVYHAGVGQSGNVSVAAFVASYDEYFSKWHSRVCLQAQHQELIDWLKQCFVSAIKNYKDENGSYPQMIFVYRDGVGDGQLETVQKYEVKQLLDAFKIICPDYNPQLSVVVVQKRVNARIFQKGRELVNPASGTVVDSDITRRYLYDFYLVSQHVGQGTVSPTHYIVLHDGAGIKADHMQRFTYKLCHLYYNWSGTIRVPAPCQYAHKLANLVGQSLKTNPDPSLNNLLFYL